MATTGATASAAVVPDRPPPLRLDSIPTVDLRLLSQSELYALSLCSNSSFDVNRCDDVVIPKINRSVFNESAGSRKQTYSRFRLAPADSSTKTTIHRRTPHLRSSHAPPSNNVNDPEQAENSQIIRMLKQLCKSDPNFEDLVTVQVENDSNVLVPELVIPEIKRKRGRPRKHENAVFLRPPAAKRMRNDTVKKEVAFDNDMDRETVNSRGVTVNMENLSRLEDPYGPEIRRRTEGMLTEDVLLGFLSGLNGQWVSRRKKKRIIDASDFGDVLPKGWKLSLSIKKKEGRVWLFCRRYISPSGRQFESCKEVSTYLLSIVGEENVDKPSHTHTHTHTHTHSNSCDDSALKEASGTSADLVVQEDIKRNSPVCDPSPPSTCLPSDCEKQVNADPVDVQVGELFKCLKCFMIFEGKDDLWDHQVSVHKTERTQLASATSDWILVKGGTFECQMYHTTFNERNQHNVHIGTHTVNEIKTCETSQDPTAQKDVDPVLATEIPDKELPASVVVETYEKSASPQSDDKITSEELVHDLNDTLAHGNHVNMDVDVLVECGDKTEKKGVMDGNEDPQTAKASDVSVSKSDFCLGHEASTSINESNGKIETCGETVDKSSDCNLEQGTSFGVINQDPVSETGVTPVDDKSECVIEQGRSAASASPSPFSNELPGSAIDVGKVVVGKSETGVVISNLFEEKDFGANMDDAFDELTSEKDGVFHNGVGFDDDCVTQVIKLSDSDSHSLVSPSNATLISSKKQESPRKIDFAGSTITASVDQVTRGVDGASLKLDGQYDVQSNSFDSYNVSSMNVMTTVEKEDKFKSHSSISWHEKECANEKVGRKVPVSTMEEPRTQMNTESFHVENGSSNKSGETNLDDFQIFRNNESIASLGSNRNGLNASVLAFNSEKNLEFSSLVPSGNEQVSFEFQDDVTGLYDSTMEECKQESSERGLLDNFCISETSDDIFGNKMYSTPLDGLKFDQDRDIGMHELSLAFGNPHHHALYADTISVDQKKDVVNCSVVRSKIDDTFDVQTSLSMVNNSMVENLKGGIEFSLSSNNDTSAFQNNSNAIYPGRAWDVYRSSQEKNFMMGSGSNQRHRDEVVPSGMWKTGQGSQLQRGLANPQAHIQSPSCFHSFDIMSDKAAEDGLFRLNERYNDGSGVSGGRSGRSEPMEFSFLTATSQQHNNNPHSVQGDSRRFSYNTAMDQAFDSSFWIGKNTMMPNRNVVTSVCAWCRNEFHLQPIMHHPHPQTQPSLCPACTAGISGQVTML